MHSAILAAEGRTGIVCVDTKHVSAGQAAVVLAMARYLKENPETTVEEAAAMARTISDRTRMSFIPGDLDYLRAGGRVSNAAYLGAKILSLHPLIEIQDGKLISTKKYRGNKAKVVRQVARECLDLLERSEPVYFVYGEGLDEAIRRDVEHIAKELGFDAFLWVKTGCVIAAHSGPGAFGVVGSAR